MRSRRITRHGTTGRPGWSVKQTRIVMAGSGSWSCWQPACWSALQGSFRTTTSISQKARQDGLTFHGLTISVFGSLIPGFTLVNTLLAKMHPIPHWPLIVTLIALYGIIVILFYLLLELLFGPCPAIVALTAVATTSGMFGVPLTWWTPGINLLPAVAAALLALQGLVRHAVTGRRRHLVVAAIGFAVGVAFYDPTMAVLVALVLFTVLYLADPRDWRSVVRALRARMILWLGCAIPIVLNLSWRALHPTEYALPPVAGIGKLFRFMGAGWAQGFAPTPLGIDYSRIGTAWRWEAVVLAQAFVVGIVIVSVVRRPSAWKAWVWFAASFLTTDAVVAVGRAALPISFAWNALYWLVLGLQFWIAVALAYLPSAVTIAGRPLAAPAPTRGLHSIRKDHTSRRVLIGSAMALVLCALGLHEAWSTFDRGFGVDNTHYLANLRASWQAVSHADPTAFIWDTPAPDFVLSPPSHRSTNCPRRSALWSPDYVSTPSEVMVM